VLLVKKLIANFVEIEWPLGNETSIDSKNVIQGLLNPDPMFRFKAEDIKGSPYFKSVDWKTVREMPAPFIPRPDDKLDTSYFDGKL
jgi:hypothetical protein